MGLLNNFIKAIINEKPKYNKQSVPFDDVEYNKHNNAKIKEFTDKYDLSTKEGIDSIPISEATKYHDPMSVSVVYMPEQILKRKATEYKKEKEYELAIECLRKANELLPHSPFSYSRQDYERLVDVLVQAGKYEEAKIEHKKLDEQYGTRLAELHLLQDFETNPKNRKEYQKSVIDPYVEESTDREHYYWLLENKPEIAPKSFSSFRRMKNQKSDNYKKIVAELLKDGNAINKISFWK